MKKLALGAALLSLTLLSACQKAIVRPIDQELLKRERCQTIVEARMEANRPLINEELQQLLDQCVGKADKMFNRLESIEAIQSGKIKEDGTK